VTTGKNARPAKGRSGPMGREGVAAVEVSYVKVVYKPLFILIQASL
jgi:hypothetical protein